MVAHVLTWPWSAVSRGDGLDAKRVGIQTGDVLDLLIFKMNVAQFEAGVHKPVAAKHGRKWKSVSFQQERKTRCEGVKDLQYVQIRFPIITASVCLNMLHLTLKNVTKLPKC